MTKYPEFNDDYDLVLAAVTSRPDVTQIFNTLRYASERLADNKDLVLEAVKTDGYMLRFASIRLRDDTDVVIAAVSNRGYALQHASTRLYNMFGTDGSTA